MSSAIGVTVLQAAAGLSVAAYWFMQISFENLYARQARYERKILCLILRTEGSAGILASGDMNLYLTSTLRGLPWLRLSPPAINLRQSQITRSQRRAIFHAGPIMLKRRQMDGSSD